MTSVKIKPKEKLSFKEKLVVIACIFFIMWGMISFAHFVAGNYVNWQQWKHSEQIKERFNQHEAENKRIIEVVRCLQEEKEEEEAYKPTSREVTSTSFVWFLFRRDCESIDL